MTYAHGNTGRPNIICYHTTDAADAILRDGFRDATGSYMFAIIELTGYWLGDTIMGVNEGATGDQVLWVEWPDDVGLVSSRSSRTRSPTANGAYPPP